MKPFLDEIFWRIYQPLDGNLNYALVDVFKYNSLTDRTFIELKGEMKEGRQSVFIPERVIENISAFRDRVETQLTSLIKSKSSFLTQKDDGTWWIDDSYL